MNEIEKIKISKTETIIDNKPVVDNVIIDTLVECYCENDDFCSICKTLGLHKNMLDMKPGECTEVLKKSLKERFIL